MISPQAGERIKLPVRNRVYLVVGSIFWDGKERKLLSRVMPDGTLAEPIEYPASYLGSYVYA